MHSEIIKEIRDTGYKGDLSSYNRTELLAILEFGDPRAFAQIEYDYIEGYSQNYSMGSIDKFIRSPKERKIANKYRRITSFLDYLPDKFSAVKNHIKNYDMDKLIASFNNLRGSTIHRALVVLISERASEFGIYTDLDELKEIYDINRLNFMASKSLLLDTNILAPHKKDTLMVQVQNILLSYREQLGGSYTMVLSASRTFRDKFPNACKGSNMALIVSLLSMRMVTGTELHDLAKLHSKSDYRKVYQLLYRAEIREPEYKINNLASKIHNWNIKMPERI